MVSLATKDHPQLKAEDIELSLPTPSYTIDTLRALEQKHPDYRFTIIMGADNIAQIDRWKEAESVTNYNILVYPRPDYPTDQLDLPELCKITDAPLIEIASSDIRMWLKDGKQVACFMPAGVFDYIQKNKVY
jgi:nicotinate-nucleotide adenylyltransferase